MWFPSGSHTRDALLHAAPDTKRLAAGSVPEPCRIANVAAHTEARVMKNKVPAGKSRQEKSP
jgi:hypothetical protein